MASLLGMPFFAYTQNFEIKGVVKDSVGLPILNAIVIASTSADDTNILAYSNSDSYGTYNLVIENYSETDSIWLVVKHIAYATITEKIPLKSTIKNFRVLPKIEQLDEVILQSKRKIEIKGDTITYRVNSIKTEKDYTIEEVLERIPGVSITESGQVKYNDKPISHLYINGVDLLEGRYNIATQAIPADAVKEVDILRKHNHERIDIGRTESEDVAFNLKIKDGVSLLFGSARLEAGSPFITGLTEATPIYLKDKFQDISSLKYNNTGKTLLNFGTNLTTYNLNIMGLHLTESPIIRPPNVNGVLLSNKYWLDNNSYGITNDALHKISDSLLLKYNVNYVNELSEIASDTKTTYINNDASNTIINKSSNSLRSQRFQVGLNQEINRRSFYLKNTTELKYEDNSGREEAILNTNNISSNYENYNLSINNSTLLKKVVGNNNILQNGLVVEYQKRQENLAVFPSVYDALLGSGTNNSTLQDVYLSKFNLAGFTDYAFNLLGLQWNANQRIQYNGYNFTSNLRAEGLELQDYPYQSDFDYQKLAYTAKLRSKLQWRKLKLIWNLSPDMIHLVTNENRLAEVKKNDSYFLINFLFSARYKLSMNWNFGVSYKLNNKISDFEEIYPSAVLKDYNSLVQNPEIINQTTLQSFNPYINYSNILKSFFFKINGELSQKKSEVTYENEITTDGFMATKVIEQPNTTNNYSVSLNVSKGFLGVFNAGFTYNYHYSESQLYFNNQFLNTVSRRHGVNFNLNYDNAGWFALEYKARLNFGSSQLQTNSVENTSLFQTLQLDLYTSKYTRLNFGLDAVSSETSDSNNRNSNTLFSASFYYKPSKKLFFNLSLLNILNTPYFTTSYNSAYFVNTSQFSLRSRQLTIGLTYSL